MKTDTLVRMRFPLGRLVATPGAMREVPAREAGEALARHLCGDWGDVCQEDWAENDFSLREGFRLLSRYKTTKGAVFRIITEADRSATTILLPEEC